MQGSTVTVKGPKGTLSGEMSPDVTVAIEDTRVVCRPVSDDPKLKPAWGLVRMLISNMVVGVSSGYRRELELVGVGYRAEMKGKDLGLSVGYSQQVVVKAIDGVTFKTESPTKIVVEGIDKQRVGHAAANIREVRPPDSYKAKGIRYAGEQPRTKAGKSGVK